MNTILWALNAKCNFHCKYCYLDFPEDNNPINNKNSTNNIDISDEQIFKFIEKLEENDVSRIFIAGAEPLSNPKRILSIIKKIKQHNIQVILCTNGYLIHKYYEEIIESNVDALSISLDSYRKEYNDKYRQYPSNDGFEKVITGIEILKKYSNIKIGIYTVLTRLNLVDLEKTYKFVSNLKADYYVFQPIFLNKETELFKDLSLNSENINELKRIISRIYNNATITKLPNKEYIKMMIESIENQSKCIHNCFAGDRLFFITPDGAIHACPSSKMIPKEKEIVKIYNTELEEVFIKKKLKIKECYNFSADCVNMWQLMAFDEIL